MQLARTHDARAAAGIPHADTLPALAPRAVLPTVAAAEAQAQPTLSELLVLVLGPLSNLDTHFWLVEYAGSWVLPLVGRAQHRRCNITQVHIHRVLFM